MSEKIDDKRKQLLLTKISIMSRLTLRDNIKAAGSLLHLKIKDDEFKAGKKFLKYGLKYIWLLVFGLLVALFITMLLLTPLLLSSRVHITGNFNYDYIVWFAIEGVAFGILIDLAKNWVLTHSLFQGIIQSTCFYYSVSAAKSLGDSEFVEASFYFDKLISFINQYSKTKKAEIKAEIEICKVKVKDLFHDNIEYLCDHKLAVVKAIRENRVPSDFADNLYNLAYSLFSNETFEKSLVSKNLNQANDSLGLLVKNCQNCFKEDTFLQKHTTTHSSLKGLAGYLELLVPILVLIIPAILKLVFNYPP